MVRNTLEYLLNKNRFVLFCLFAWYWNRLVYLSVAVLFVLRCTRQLIYYDDEDDD